MLMKSKAFAQVAENNQNKELVILKEGKAISAHFPCSMINNQPLNIKYVRKKKVSVQEDKESEADLPRLVSNQKIGNHSRKVILFDVCTSGEKHTKFILKNQVIKSVCEELTVYAYEGETVQNALQKDGRFLDGVFGNACQLIQVDTKDIFEFSNVVCQNMNNKHFKIYLKPSNNQKNQKKSQPGSRRKADTANEGHQDPSQLAPAAKSEDDSPPKKKPTQNKNEALLKLVYGIPESEKLMCDLMEKFNNAMKIDLQGTNTFSQIQEHLRVEYSKNDKTCREVSVMKKLMQLSNSVCLVMVNGSRVGTGFFLFDRFVLTNYHVVKDVLGQPLRPKVCVYFMYEEFNEASVQVEGEVVVYQYDTDESGNSSDWALLKLDETVDVSCPCLLEHFGYLPPSGGLCIIGHPDCGVKMVDPCYIIPPTDYNKAVDKQCAKDPQGVWYDPKLYGAEGHIQWVGPQFFEDKKKGITEKKPVVAYNTCFFGGSSGSPVFDNECKVVAIHSGGYIYHNSKNKRKSIIEYGFLLSHIIENMIIVLVHQKRLDVLSKYLSVEYVGKENIMDGVKKLKESRGFTAFDDALQSAEVTNDKDLRDIFEFICSNEISEMEVDH